MSAPFPNESTSGIHIPGLQFSPENYAAQLGEKASAVTAGFASLAMPEFTIFASPPLHFRMRAEFRIWHDKHSEPQRCHYAMFERNAPRTPVEITHFPIACKAICEVMAPLLEKINACPMLAAKLFQVEFLASSSGEVVATLIYHRQLDAAWQTKAKALEQQLNIAIIGRARKQKIVLSRDYVIETIEVNGRSFQYEQKENSFTQPNAAINRDMITWVSQYLATPNQYSTSLSDFIELYCGNGNFTLPIAQYFRRAIGTEISKTSIASAQRNCQLNQVENIEFIRLSGAETASALQREREFRRLRHIELDSYAF
ncbi:MAG: tRNA (uridine(54)-C5)-methyltransferase TrmA, partial [Pseudomonadales bacterium]|nr:tRNA (uridine(54)-C5)-methyltransferase TrmA [Pseudomonadales bacterium]